MLILTYGAGLALRRIGESVNTRVGGNQQFHVWRTMKLNVCLLGFLSLPAWCANTTVLFQPSSPSVGPFPTNALTVAASSQKTGLQVNLPAPGGCTLTSTSSDCVNVGLLNQLDGFSVNPRITPSIAKAGREPAMDLDAFSAQANCLIFPRRKRRPEVRRLGKYRHRYATPADADRELGSGVPEIDRINFELRRATIALPDDVVVSPA